LNTKLSRPSKSGTWSSRRAEQKGKFRLPNWRNGGKRLNTVPSNIKKEPKDGTISESRSSNSSWEIREARIEKKRGDTSYEQAPCLKKERMKFISCWERFYRKKERKEIIFSYSVKCDVWPHPYPHMICICTTFYSLTFTFLNPHSLHHSPLTMIICHTNSLEFSFASTIYKVYHRYLLRVNHHKNITREGKIDWEDE
jgi:hypothetical protein